MKIEKCAVKHSQKKYWSKPKKNEKGRIMEEEEQEEQEEQEQEHGIFIVGRNAN